MKILAIDTCTKSGSVTLCEDDFILSSNYINVKITHSETLLPLVEQVLANTKTKIEDIDLFSVSKGPGSFTGVRIGVSVVKGLAFESKKNCLGISSLLGVAYQCQDIDGIICPVLDARKNQFYTAMFSSENKKISRLTEDNALNIDEITEIIKNSVFSWRRVGFVL